MSLIPKTHSGMAELCHLLIKQLVIKSYDTLNFGESKSAELSFQERVVYLERFNMCIHINESESYQKRQVDKVI